MNTIICCIHDNKAGAYGNLLTFQARGQAIRSFADVVNEPEKKTDIGKHPEDFTLFYVADYDPSTGELVPLVPRVVLANAIDLADDQLGGSR